MPLFAVTKTTLSTVDQTNFATEKDLQTLIERNLESVFGCRFVATEFPTGVQHAGRIDTLALSEDNNPVKWGIHLTQVAPRRCGLVDPWTPAHCTQNAPWGARRRSAGNWATRLRFGPIKDYARAMAIAGLETWCYRQAFPGAANGQPQYVVVT